MKYDLIVRGGLASLERGPVRADIFVRNGTITRVARPRSGPLPPARRVIDASGLLVLPGVIDAHAHFSLHLGGGKMTSDDFYSGSAAAACGGVTSIIDYTGQAPGVPLAEGLRTRLEEADGLMHVDYGFHSVVPSWNRLSGPAGQMKAMMALGVPSFKFFTAYGSRGLMASDAELFEALETSGRIGALICVHAESGGIIDLLTRRAARSVRRAVSAHLLSRPDFTEWEAVNRLLVLAGCAGGNVYLVHLSSGISAGLIAAARAAGIRAVGETCPQYLTLDDSLLSRGDGHLYATCPPLRKREDSRKLWSALRDGALKVVATDNCTFTRAQKGPGKNDLSRLFMGIPGTQTLLPLLYTFGVVQRRMTLTAMTRALSMDPARIMGLYPRKGVIRPGSDADLAIVDPGEKRKVDFRKLKHRTDYSPYQGMELAGWAKITVLRGTVVSEGGELTVPDRPSGVFLRRGAPLLKDPA